MLMSGKISISKTSSNCLIYKWNIYTFVCAAIIICQLMRAFMVFSLLFVSYYASLYQENYSKTFMFNLWIKWKRWRIWEQLVCGWDRLPFWKHIKLNYTADSHCTTLYIYRNQFDFIARCSLFSFMPSFHFILFVCLCMRVFFVFRFGFDIILVEMIPPE